MQSHNTRVLALLPHPDDIEILCAGTLVRLREAGCEIHCATMTAGDKGSAELSREAIAAIRREEAKRGAQVLGAASTRCLEFSDLEITFDNPSRRRVTSVLREVAPEIVFTTPPRDYMFDHEITSHLVRDACFNASCKNYEADGAPLAWIPHLYYTDAVSGHNLWGAPSPVSCVVDISSAMETKTEALKCHDSQRAWLLKQHGMDDYIETMRAWSAKRGQEIGVAFAEAFFQHRGHPYPQNDVISELLHSVTLQTDDNQSAQPDEPLTETAL